MRENSFEVISLGGMDTVTGSCHLFRANGATILVECGLAQGRDRVVPMEDWPVAPGDIDYLFLTHAHIDHIGRVPDLIDVGFSDEIICTLPTRELLFQGGLLTGMGPWKDRRERFV